jgi:outer membrane protein assembly factor BamD (BamD/ComL family)
MKLIVGAKKMSGRIVGGGSSTWRRRVARRVFGRLSLPARVALGAMVCASVVVGCGWFGPPNSVRFMGWEGETNERRYSRLPALSVGGEDDFAKRKIGEYTEESYEDEERRSKELNAQWLTAVDLNQVIDRDALMQSRSILSARLKEFGDQDKRNTALDLLDAFTALDEGSTPASVHAYMKARHAYDSWLVVGAPATGYVYPKPPERTAEEIDTEKKEKMEAVRAALDEAPTDRNLSDNVAYLRAAILYRSSNYEDAASAFESLALRFPYSEKREASLLMAGLSHLKLSSSYKEGDESAVASDPCADCRDAEWMAARAAFARLIREYPRGRYRLDARGWLAFSSLRVGDTGAGLAEYYRLLAADPDKAARFNALTSLSLARDKADEAAMREVEAELSREPEAALAYAYHEIYNHAARLDSWDLPVDEDEESGGSSSNESESQLATSEREERNEQRVHDESEKELRRVVAFAASMVKRYPRTRVGGEFALRLAEADFELDKARETREFAVRALGAGLAGERRDEALWTKGVAEYRLREYDAARRTLKVLVGEDPRGKLAAGARRLVAMISEDMGDLDSALEQYLALDYKEDAAYFVDVLMTPEQLASFVEHRPDLPQRDALNYALGVRYLRDGRYAEARAAYARVRTTQTGDRLWDNNTECRDNQSVWENARCGSAKEWVSEYSLRTDPNDYAVDIQERWVLRDLQTATDLEALDRAYQSAQDDEAKAEALYQKASYLFESDLLFYNPAAWQGVRFWNLADLDENHRYRAPGEAAQLFCYMEQHDMASRALNVYLEVVNKFPQTRAARDAFYSAAVCHERLAGYNAYWRDKYQSGLHAGARMVTYADVRATYPDYKLPRGTYGWQPSTRTVNGKPGWDAPPKPKPPLTRSERAERYIDHCWRVAGRVWQPIQSFVVNPWEDWAKRWLIAALILVCALRWRRPAARARARLREQYVRLKPTVIRADVEASPTLIALTAPPAPWLVGQDGEASRAKRAVKIARRAWRVMRVTARPAWRRVEPLLRDAGGRSALASFVATHSLLFALFIMLLHTLQLGGL